MLSAELLLENRLDVGPVDLIDLIEHRLCHLRESQRAGLGEIRKLDRTTGVRRELRDQRRAGPWSEFPASDAELGSCF